MIVTRRCSDGQDTTRVYPGVQGGGRAPGGRGGADSGGGGSRPRDQPECVVSLEAAGDGIDRRRVSGQRPAAAPNRVWVSDLTYIPTREGWLYLAVVLDPYSRQIVGWAADQHMSRDVALRALQTAVARRRPPPGLLHHSDRGSQYRNPAYQAQLAAQGFHSSRSAVATCADNAVVESFFHTLKTERVQGQRYHTRAEARADVFEYIECWYNVRRRHSSLAYLSPATFERLHDV